MKAIWVFHIISITIISSEDVTRNTKDTATPVKIIFKSDKVRK